LAETEKPVIWMMLPFGFIVLGCSGGGSCCIYLHMPCCPNLRQAEEKCHPELVAEKIAGVSSLLEC